MPFMVPPEHISGSVKACEKAQQGTLFSSSQSTFNPFPLQPFISILNLSHTLNLPSVIITLEAIGVLHHGIRFEMGVYVIYDFIRSGLRHIPPSRREYHGQSHGLVRGE